MALWKPRVRVPPGPLELHNEKAANRSSKPSLQRAGDGGSPASKRSQGALSVSKKAELAWELCW